MTATKKPASSPTTTSPTSLFFKYKYISDKGMSALRAYKYHGQDLSYVYRYILTPMNKFIVQLLPMWLAPNLITFSGLCLTIFTHALCIYYSPSMDVPLPSWLCFWVGATMLLYQTIDNVDGHQARRTSSGSPLGLLFDHGVDSLNVTISTLSVCSVLRLGSHWQALSMWCSVLIPFAFATWEEFHTNQLILPEINGPTDGMILSASFCFLAAYAPHFWDSPLGSHISWIPSKHLASMACKEILVYVTLGAVFITISNNIKNVRRDCPNVTFKYAFLTVAPFLFMLTTTFIWFAYSPSGIFQQHARVFLVSNGFVFSKIVCRMMLSHLTSDRYQLVHTILITYAVVVITSLYFGSKDSTLETTLLFIQAIYAFLTWLHFVLCVNKEITTGLGIHTFHLKPAQKKSS